MADPSILDFVSGSQTLWTNWSKEITYHPELRFKPRNSDDIRMIVQCAEAHSPPMRLKAAGSGWAYERIAVTDNYLIETDQLDQILFVATENGPYPDAILQRTPLKEDVFTRLDALDQLDPLNGKRALVCVQAGIKLGELYSRLKDLGLGLPTMGGSSGQSLAGAISTSTHGGDVARPPLADWVRAIHLVGSGGREYWVEPSGDRSITDEDRWPTTNTWHPELEVIYEDDVFAACLVSLGRMGVVHAVILEVVDNYYLKEIRAAQPWDELRESIRTKTPADLYRSFEFDGQKLHFLQLFLSLGWDNHCHVTRRILTDSTKIIPAYEFDIHSFAEDIFANPEALWQVVKLGITSEGHAVELLGSTDALPRIANGMDNGQRRWWTNFLWNAQQTGHTTQGPYYYVMDKTFGGGGLNPPPDITLEYTFDVEDPTYLRFVDEVLVMANSPQILGYISLRYTLGSQGLLAMQKFTYSVCIEVAAMQGVSGSEAFLEQVHIRAKLLGGVPHWGLANNSSRQEIEEFYGDKLRTWRFVLGRLSQVGDCNTFRNRYTYEKELEPLGCGGQTGSRGVRGDSLLFTGASEQ